MRSSTERATAAVAAVMPSAVKVGTHSGSGDLRVGNMKLVVAWAGEGNLGDARTVLAGPRKPDIVVARRLSPGARKELSQAGVGWVDETGAAEIAIDSIIVSRTGWPSPSAKKPPHWTPATIAVSEALLCGTRATVEATQSATGLSTGSCTQALRTLTDLGLLDASADRGPGSARQVLNRDGFLAAYSAAATALRHPLALQVGVTWRDPVAGLVESGSHWDTAKLKWAATGIAAASILAPYLTTVTTAEVYVNASTILDLEAAATKAGMQPIQGGRLTLRPFPTASADRLAETVDGLRIAPWPRVYVDLLTSGVRGEEAAEHLREVKDAR